MNRTLLVSIRPEFAEKIFGGTKTVELRRQRPRINPGDTVLIYVSSPVKALGGSFEVDTVETAEPCQLWRIVRARAGISKAQFDSYYEGTNRAYGIGVKTAKRIQPVSLAQLRKKIDNFHPPQSYRYLSDAQVKTLKRA